MTSFPAFGFGARSSADGLRLKSADPQEPGEWLRRTEPIPPVYIDSDTLMISTPVSERHGPFTSQNDDDPGTDAAPPVKGTDYR